MSFIQVAELVLLIIAAVFLLLRLYTRVYLLGRFAVPDALLIFAWICLLCNNVGDLYCYRWGLWSPELRYTWETGKMVLPDFDGVMKDTTMIVKVLKVRNAFKRKMSKNTNIHLKKLMLTKYKFSCNMLVLF